MMTNQETQLAALLGMSTDRQQVIDNSPESAPLELIQDDSPTEVSKTNSFATSSLNRLYLIAGVSGLIIFSAIAFFRSAFSFSQPVAKQPEPTTKETEIKIAKTTVDNEAKARIALYKQEQELKALENLKAKSETPAPEIKIHRHSKPIPTQVATTPKPIEQPVKPISQPKPITPLSHRQTPTIPKIIQYDSLADWSRLATLGSVGYAPASPTDNTTLLSSLPQTSLVASTQLSPNLLTPPSTKLPPLLAANYNSIADVIAAETRFIDLLHSPTTNMVETQNTQTIAIAQRVKAYLAYPVHLSTDRNQPVQRSFLILDEPLLDREGAEVIPTDSQIVFEIESIRGGGIVYGRAVAVIIDGVEKPLPAEAITVNGKKGGMLMAKLKNQANSDNRDLINFGLGAVEGLSQALSQPDSTFSSLSSFGSTQSVDYGDRNYPQQALAQGVTKILEERANQLAQQSRNIPNLSYWELKEDTEVTIAVNKSFEL